MTHNSELAMRNGKRGIVPELRIIAEQPQALTQREEKRLHWRNRRTEARRGLAPAPVGRKPGRPPIYTPELGAKIFERIIESGTVKRACADPDMPDEHTLYVWAARDPEFRQLFVHAREMAVERWAEEIIEIADNPVLDPLDKRVRIDARRWIMGKLAPRRFGDRVQIAGDSTAPVVVSVAGDLSTYSDEELGLVERLVDLRMHAIATTGGNTIDHQAASGD